MTGTEPFPFSFSHFQLAAVELRQLGITLARLPGEYRINFRDGADATAQTAETLNEAVELGRIMAALTTAAAAPARGQHRRRPRRMTPKAHNKRLRMAQLRRMRAHAIHQQCYDGKRED